jgi:hypothetical protein
MLTALIVDMMVGRDKTMFSMSCGML